MSIREQALINKIINEEGKEEGQQETIWSGLSPNAKLITRPADSSERSGSSSLIVSQSCIEFSKLLKNAAALQKNKDIGESEIEEGDEDYDEEASDYDDEIYSDSLSKLNSISECDKEDESHYVSIQQQNTFKMKGIVHHNSSQFKIVSSKKSEGFQAC